MPLTVEDGSGLSGADAYASVADADSYHATRGATVWAAADNVAKEAAIVRATTWVDATYRTRFPGARLNGRAQALEWPRRDARDAAGESIASDEVPREVAEATIEAALREIQAPNSLSPDVTPGQTKTLVQVEGLRWKPNGRSGMNAQKPVLYAVDGIMATLVGAKTGNLLRA